MAVIDMNFCYVAGSAAGALGHWAIKFLNDEVECLMDMARTEQKRTLASIAAQVVASYLAVASGQIELVAPTAAFLAGAMQGGAIDAFINKGRRGEWTTEKRESLQPKGEVK